jgi:hypothetical protein
LGFVKHERRTAPRLLPLWAISFVALAGYQPGSTAWSFAAMGALALGILVIPLVGSIAPTVTAYLTLLSAVVLMLVMSAWLPLQAWYDKAWLDQGPTGVVAMMLLGAAVVGGFTSVLWAALVLIEAARRAVRRFRTGSPIPPGAGTAAAPIALVPGSRRAKRWPRRVYVAVVCLALAAPLPSFFVMAGIFVRPMGGPHDGVGGFIGDVFTALTWPVLTTLWLLMGALIAWLMESRAIVNSRVALGAMAGLGVLVAIIVISASTFAIAPGAGAQGFAPSVAEYCPDGEPQCQPEWLYSVPVLAEVTGSVAPWFATLTLLATAAVVALVLRRHGGGTGASPRA